MLDPSKPIHDLGGRPAVAAGGTPPVFVLRPERRASFGTAISLTLLLLAATVGCSAPGAVGSTGDTPPAAVAGEGASSPNTAAIAAPGPAPVASGTWVCPDEPIEPSYEPTLFVDDEGSDDHDGRDAGRPLATLQRAADLVEPGDVVWVSDGVYSADVEFTTSGTADAPIVFESRPGECAILDGSDDADGTRVTFDGVRHMVFRNFVVRNSSAEGVYLIDSHENVISHVRTHDNYYSGITNVDGDENLFRYVISHGNADASGGDADGISISSGDGNRVEHCVTYGNSDDGVDTWRSTNTLIERCVSFRNGGRGGDGNGFKAGGGRQQVDTVVRYSIAFENRSNGFDYNTGGHVTFDHNTAFANGGYGFVATEALLRNNLSVDNGSGNLYGEPGASETPSNSWEFGLRAPGFVSTRDADRDFLRLGEASSAIDAGIDLGLPFEGAAPDLGALEAGQTISATFGVDLARVTNF